MDRHQPTTPRALTPCSTLTPPLPLRPPCHGIIEVTRTGQIRWATAFAQQWLETYWNHRHQDSCLPDSLRAWLRQQHTVPALALQRPVLTMTQGTRRLTVRLLRDAQRDCLLLEERVEHSPTDAYKTLGLTQREAEVLTWLTQGKTNAEIGLILSISPRTVQKHLEHIYQRLGVETRVAATRALDRLAGIVA